MIKKKKGKSAAALRTLQKFSLDNVIRSDSDLNVKQLYLR